MNNYLRFEEASLFILGIYFFNFLYYPWWVFVVLLFIPDISMVGYLVNNEIGAKLYNFFHSRLLAVLIMFFGWYANSHLISLVGIILFSHIAMDRMLNFGLKYPDSFKHTHLGKIK